MRNIRSIFSRHALGAIIAAATTVISAPVARADYGSDVAIQQADCNVSTAQQALDYARSQQSATDAALAAANNRVNADQQRVDQIDRAIASLTENLRGANQALELKRIAMNTVRQRYDAAVASAQAAFNNAFARLADRPDFQQADRAAREAQQRVDDAARAMIACGEDYFAMNAAAARLSAEFANLDAAIGARQRVVDEMNRTASLDPAFVAANQTVQREQPTLDAVTADVNKVAYDCAAISASLQRATADRDDARASLARSTQDDDAARAASNAAAQAVAQAQWNLDSAYSYASYTRSAREAELARYQANYDWCPPQEQVVVVQPSCPPPAPVVVVQQPPPARPQPVIVVSEKVPREWPRPRSISADGRKVEERRAPDNRDQHQQEQREARIDRSREEQRQREADRTRDTRIAADTRAKAQADQPAKSTSTARRESADDSSRRAAQPAQPPPAQPKAQQQSPKSSPPPAPPAEVRPRAASSPARSTQSTPPPTRSDPQKADDQDRGNRYKK